MAQFTDTQYLKAFEDVKPALHDVLFAEKTSNTIAKTVARHNLDAKALEISAATAYVLVGLLPVNQFIAHLTERGLAADAARNVAYDIRKEIFAPVAKELAAMQGRAKMLHQAHVTKTTSNKDESVTRTVEKAPKKPSSPPAEAAKSDPTPPPTPPPNLPV